MQILAAALEGLQKAEGKLDQTASRLSNLGALTNSAPAQPTPATPAPTDAVDLSTEMLNLITARTEYDVNLKSLQTGEQMVKHTLDILG